MNEETFLDLVVYRDDETNEMVLVDQGDMKEVMRLDGTSENRMLLECVARVLDRFAQVSFNQGYDDGFADGKKDKLERVKISLKHFFQP